MTQWVRFEHQGATGFGALAGQEILVHEGDMLASPRDTGRRVALAGVRLLVPVAPSKIVALVNNFHALNQKFNNPTPSEPLYFFKAQNSLNPHGAPIRRPRAYAGKIIYEGELGLVIGARCRDVSVEDASRFLFGCTCVNDVTSIELLKKDASFDQWTRAKAADTFGCVGPAVATGLDPATLAVRTLLDGQERQSYPVSDMVFTAYELISHISRDMTLEPGDLISCGTSVGVGSMKAGSVVEIHIDGVGTLRNTVE
jgi:2-keto-4-pentenoate hydratase/2-oxohepta-3-ene-1,7-dioic acid hydratase in catechol pathway